MSEVILNGLQLWLWRDPEKLGILPERSLSSHRKAFDLKSTEQGSVFANTENSGLHSLCALFEKLAKSYLSVLYLWGCKCFIHKAHSIVVPMRAAYASLIERSYQRWGVRGLGVLWVVVYISKDLYLRLRQCEGGGSCFGVCAAQQPQFASLQKWLNLLQKLGRDLLLMVNNRVESWIQARMVWGKACQVFFSAAKPCQCLVVEGSQLPARYFTVFLLRQLSIIQEVF